MAKSGLGKWLGIRRYITRSHIYFSDNNTATIKTPTLRIYISKTANKFRIKSHIDWAYYTPQELADAINRDDVDVYYETQLKHQLSDPNIWKRLDEEQDIKSYYAARAGRASRI